ncbi:unnamed protein product [Lactuca virosa]|uniref:Uncharacterized protein n=1 Tax=Lactuca virosa TaxID=75947 RepID=A0AAU9MBD9_9ASTR|nr:unnamed protein product [Lactuca virosa]
MFIPWIVNVTVHSANVLSSLSPLFSALDTCQLNDRPTPIDPWPGDLRTPWLQVSFLNLQVPFSLTIFVTVSL